MQTENSEAIKNWPHRTVQTGRQKGDRSDPTDSGDLRLEDYTARPYGGIA